MLPDSAGTSGNAFRIVVLSGAPPRVLARLLSELCRSTQPMQVTGVLYWVQSPKRLPDRIRNLLSQFRKPGYLSYVGHRLKSSLADRVRRGGQFLWKMVHAHFPSEDSFGVEQLAEHCRQLGIPFQTTSRFHSDTSLQFVAQGQPDLGIVYGTPILKPCLFELPRLGSINLHQRKVPDYRGGGPIALWEMLNGESEIGVTVHRVAEKLDAGAVIRSATLPIEPADTLTSLELKAHVVGIDLLVGAATDFATGQVRETPQTGEGRMYRNPKPEAMRELLAELQDLRGIPKAELTYPLWKLLARYVVLTPWLAVRNWYRRFTGTFPLVVLYHHVITERPHFLGMSTDQFLHQMQYLRRYYDIVDLKTGMERLRSGRISRPTVVLTLDDGYRDNVINLRAAALDGDVPATLYVCPGHIETQQAFGHDVQRGHDDFPPMSWDELRCLEAWGFHFGAHTRFHFDCGSHDEATLIDQIAVCRRELEAQVGHEVPDFSYPFGLPQNISERAFRIAHDNYQTVATAYGGVNRCGQEDPQHLYRIPHPTSLLEVELLLQQALVFGQPELWRGGGPPEESTSTPTTEQNQSTTATACVR
ncbi:MAG: polysaccharide deacetylase family protein [Planctomycetaceae bacterium]|nr:polysaccharide deacetylase family protein [Planctomycetaceae bacterium]